MVAASDAQDLALFMSDDEEEDDLSQQDEPSTRELARGADSGSRSGASTDDAFECANGRNESEENDVIRLQQQISQQLEPIYSSGGQSIDAILGQIRPNANDEVSVALVISQLSALPQDRQTSALIELLRNLREEFAPKDAIMSIWYKLLHPKLAKRVKSAGTIPIIRSRLLEARTNAHSLPSKRKQAECDLKLLQNRISLLQQEESRAWKKIVQTKDRANEVMGIREANIKRYEHKTHLALEKEKQTRSIQKKQHSLKKESVIKKKHAAIQIISKKYQDVEIVKSESKRLKAEKEKQQLVEVERAREKREAIRRQEEMIKEKREQERVQHEQEVALRYMRKVIDEERRIKDHQRRVEEMERHERELIQRLQGTQLIQQEAFSVLERALLQHSHSNSDSRPPSTSHTILPGVRRVER